MYLYSPLHLLFLPRHCSHALLTFRRVAGRTRRSAPMLLCNSAPTGVNVPVPRQDALTLALMLPLLLSLPALTGRKVS
jgi:hypothetical protein